MFPSLKKTHEMTLRWRVPLKTPCPCPNSCQVAQGHLQAPPLPHPKGPELASQPLLPTGLIQGSGGSGPHFSSLSNGHLTSLNIIKNSCSYSSKRSYVKFIQNVLVTIIFEHRDAGFQNSNQWKRFHSWERFIQCVPWRHKKNIHESWISSLSWSKKGDPKCHLSAIWLIRVNKYLR